MAQTFITINGTVTSAELREVNSNGSTISGGLTIIGSKVGSTNVYVFQILYSRFYTLYVNGTEVLTAKTLFLNGGEDFITTDINSGSVTTKMKLSIDMDSHTITNLQEGSNDGDAVNYGQVKGVIGAPIGISPTPNLDIDSSNMFLIMTLTGVDVSTIRRDNTIIFFYYVNASSGNTAAIINENGKISAGDNVVYQTTEKTPYCIMPKLGFQSNKYVHYGYAVMTSSGKTECKQGSSGIKIPDSWTGIDSAFDNLSGITHSISNNPLIVDAGNQIIVTIPNDEQPNKVCEFEIAYNFLAIGSTQPTINIDGNIVNLGNYVIMKNSSRTFIINKPILTANTAGYNIWVTYRFVGPFTKSNWWKDGNSRLKNFTVSKFPSKLNADDLDAILDQVIEKLYTDTTTGVISRK